MQYVATFRSDKVIKPLSELIFGEIGVIVANPYSNNVGTILLRTPIRGCKVAQCIDGSDTYTNLDLCARIIVRIIQPGDTIVAFE